MGETDVWLPEGRWTDIFTGLVYDGGRRLHMLRDMGSIPALANPEPCLRSTLSPTAAARSLKNCSCAFFRERGLQTV